MLRNGSALSVNIARRLSDKHISSATLSRTSEGLRLDQISVSVIERLRDTRRRTGLSPQTVNKVLTTTTAIFKLAVRRNYWTSNPAANAERLRATTAELAEDGSHPVRDAHTFRSRRGGLESSRITAFARGCGAGFLSDIIRDRGPHRDATR